MTGFVLLSLSDCVSLLSAEVNKNSQPLILWFASDYIIYSKTKTKTNTSEFFSSLTFFYKDLLCYKQIFKGHLSRSNHLLLVEPILLLFFFDTSVGIRLPLAAYVEICISFDVRNSQMTSTATIDLHGI